MSRAGLSPIARALVFTALMLAAAALAELMRPRVYIADQAGGRERLAAIVPEAFGDWQVDRSIVPIPPSPDLQKVLDETYDETLARTYRHSDGRRVMLSLAYGRNQHKGMNTHRPEICYPAQGFKLLTGTDRGSLSVDGRALGVQRLVAGLGARIEPITYWLTVGGEVTAFGSEQRLATIRYGLKGQVPDGVLVRISTIDDDAASAYITHEQFARAMLQSLAPAQRARLVGDV